jgi:hypothetical protein
MHIQLLHQLRLKSSVAAISQHLMSAATAKKYYG